MFTHRSTTAILLTTLLVSACSGGSDSSDDGGTQPPVQSNSAPQANAGADQTAQVGATITVDASTSTDSDGDSLTYSWMFTSRPSGSAAQLNATNQVSASFTADVAGSYELSVTVNDGEDTDSDSVRIEVEAVTPENTAPVANAGGNQSVLTGATVNLDGSASSDADGDSLTYLWALTAVPSGSTAQLQTSNQATSSFVADIDGNYEISLTVNDGVTSNTDTLVVVANSQNSENAAPIANAGEDFEGTVGTEVTLDASASSDADGDSLSYLWSSVQIPNGSSASILNSDSVRASFTPDVAGLYVFRVAVSDGVNDTVGDNVRLTVTEAAGSNLDAWIINTTETTDFITNSSGNSVLEDVQLAEIRTEDSVEYMYVEATGIPKYDITMTQDIIDELNSRPQADDDFRGGGNTTTAVVGQEVTFGDDIGYRSSNINCEDTGGDGYWPPGPACPTDQEKQNYFPAEPQANDDECVSGLGAVGMMVNGTSIYNWGDGMSYNNEGAWYNLAPIAEQYDVDICGGHATTTGDYHHHFYTSCLANLLGDDGTDHSPIYGFAADGYPVYGPYEANGELAISGWKTRDYGASASEGGCGTPGERTCTLVDEYDVSQGVETATAGPDIGDSVQSASGNTFSATDGFYYEDYYYAGLTASGAQLDQHNGHENGDGRGYHYHLTLEMVDGKLTPAFPFTVGPNFKGELPSNTFARCSGSGGMGPRNN